MRRVRPRHLLVLLVLATALAGIGGPGVGAAGTGPTGYTSTLALNNDPICQFGSIDTGAGGALTPIGPARDLFTEGCPDDLAMRAGDPAVYGIAQTFPSALGSVTAADVPAGAVSVTLDGADAGATAVPSATLVATDPATGARTTVGPLGFVVGQVSAQPVPTFFLGTSGLAFDRFGTLWFYGLTTDPSCNPDFSAVRSCLYRIDPASGAASFVAAGPPFKVTESTPATTVHGMTSTCTDVLASSTTEVFVPNDHPSATASLVTVNTTNAALVPAPSPFGPSPLIVSGMERDATGVLRAVSEDTSWHTATVDPTSGVATTVADLSSATPVAYLGLAIPPGLQCPVELAPRFAG